MISLVREKEKAIELRKQGWTYNEILKELPVAKSSLSLWLKDFPLTEREREYLKSRRDSNISMGRIKAATSNRVNRLERQGILAKQAELEFEKRRWDPLFLVGVALYWAEGSRSNTQVQFTSSNPEVIEVFILWLEKFINLKRETLSLKKLTPKKEVVASYRGSMRVSVPRNPRLLIKMRVWKEMLARKYS
jgi:hypothetical protein